MSDEFNFYESYNAERYIHYRLVETGEFENVETKRGAGVLNVRKPILVKHVVSFEDVKKINLDDYGLDVRTHAGSFTQIHNYFLDFWGSILGSDAVALFMHLKRYCYGELKDFCFPNIELIQFKMKKGSKNTILKNLELLEKYGFIAKILRMDVERNNALSSSFIKIRRYIPVLSQELIDSLPNRLKQEHDEFIANANGIILNEDFSVKEAVRDLIETAVVMKSKSQETKEKELKREGRLLEYTMSQLNDVEIEEWKLILDHIKDLLGKPSFDTWFSRTVLKVKQDSGEVVALCPNTFCSEWIRTRHADLIKQAASTVFQKDFLGVTCYTYEEFYK